MPKNGVLGVAVALGGIGFGVPEATAAGDGGLCRGYAYVPRSFTHRPRFMPMHHPRFMRMHRPPKACFGAHSSDG